LTETDPTVPLEWQPLLEDLAYALDRIEDPNTLTSSDRRVFDETVVATLGSPYFLPIEELRASHSLRSISGLAAGAAEREGRVRRETRVIFERATDFGERKKLINEGLRWFEEHGGNLGF
jgi:hypothetical protein